MARTERDSIAIKPNEPLDVVEFGRLTDEQRVELARGEADPFDAAGNTLRWRLKHRHVTLRGPDRMFFVGGRPTFHP